jgi:hypothetical protein
MLQRVGESDHVPTVCGIGRWVTLIFSTSYYPTGVCVCTSYKSNKFVSVVNGFALAATFTVFFLLDLALVEPLKLVYLPKYHHES